MKRSQVNREIRWARELLAKHGMRLPDMAYWTPEEWKKRKSELETARRLMLGWDITDFGSGDFSRLGAVLYTIRNGLMNDPGVGVPYCEKLILMREGQRLPDHYHVFKTEDIICRAGGPIAVRLWNTDCEGRATDEDVRVFTDGIARTLKAGETLFVTQGNSVTLTPRIAHIFGPAPGSGDCVIGEVSKVNDDRTDNYFLEETARFPAIEEDEPAVAPLCGEI